MPTKKKTTKQMKDAFSGKGRMSRLDAMEARALGIKPKPAPKKKK